MNSQRKLQDKQQARPETNPRDAASKLPPGLYLVATPIGNLADITVRALEALRACDVIMCEDRRATARLLRHYAITTPTQSYHDHSTASVRTAIIDRLRDGARIALVSDAGTPLISDPGYKLVRMAVAEGLHVSALPGACAPVMALSLSGLPTDRFFFAGFLPPRQSARKAQLRQLAAVPGTLIFFESPRRLVGSLADMAEIFGDRPAAVARELSKLFEEVVRGSLPTLAERYAQDGPPKGEIVILIGASEEVSQQQSEALASDLDSRLQTELAQYRLKEAVARVTADTGLPRKQVYARALALSGQD
ncbi:MAG TPA: 16S rRNA (cytidine(1402)-2'-O)-methyltransferase [Alphaproteobacteria bacterium]|nr:16S rRNA (cytidine(1402)-2'-O)-methyltransferase [Alphaproteobacteria bacterium]